MKLNILFFILFLGIIATVIFNLASDNPAPILIEDTQNNLNNQIIADDFKNSIQSESIVSDTPVNLIPKKQVAMERFDCVINHQFELSNDCATLSQLQHVDFSGITNLVIKDIQFIKSDTFEINSDSIIFISLSHLGQSDQGDIYFVQKQIVNNDGINEQAYIYPTTEQVKNNEIDALMSAIVAPDLDHLAAQAKQDTDTKPLLPACYYKQSQLIIDKKGKRITQTNCDTHPPDPHTILVSNETLGCLDVITNDLEPKYISPSNIYTFLCAYNSMNVPSSFSSFTHLIEVSVPDYKKFIPFLEALPNFQSLLLHNNPIVDSQDLINLKNLRHLEILFSDIKQSYYLNSLEKLESLVLIGVFIDDYDFIQHFTHLKSLTIQDKYLEYIPTISDPNTIERLIFRDNKISDLSELNKFKNIKYADFSLNNITNISVLDFNNFKNLTLMINGNEIDCSEIKAIDLGSNVILSDC